LDLRKLPKGIGEGGRIDQNSYVTTVFGLGVQTRLDNGMAFFFQPQFQYNVTSELNGLIKNVHSFNIVSGLRFKF
jgi:hypothetical protein